MATNCGNYSNYVSPASRFPGSAPSIHVRDARLTLLQNLIPGLFCAKHCLDIGCNAGTVSSQLALDFEAASVTGVDIDPDLVSQAEELAALRCSRLRCSITSNTPASGWHVDYFPLSAVLTHGYRFEPASKASRRPASDPVRPPWPRLNFIAADFAVSANQALTGPYEVILALSVIKWIHLEHLDDGLAKFFRKCSSSLAPGGYFIVELQDWASYQRAVRPNTAPHFSESLQKLKYRPETSFDGLLRDVGLHVYTTSDSLPRRITVYRKDGQDGQASGTGSAH